ncbi:hypothetical protein RR11_3142 [Ruegeria sp. R11]|nr:hypothetical protein RR11_3142 [Ruegeria sp. R11]
MSEKYVKTSISRIDVTPHLGPNVVTGQQLLTTAPRQAPGR